MSATKEDRTYIDLPEAARLLGVSDHALERWIRQGSIPSRRSRGAIVFEKSRLKEWAESHNMTWMEKKGQMSASPQAVGLINAIRSGGVYTGVGGEDVENVLAAAVQTVDLPDEVDREQLRKKLLEREALASTGIGHGVAVPHPRTPLKAAGEAPAIAVCFLDSPIDYKAIDGEPVFVLFMMLSPSTKVHLQMLARLGYCLRDESFIEFLRTQPDLESLCERLERMEENNGTNQTTLIRILKNEVRKKTYPTTILSITLDLYFYRRTFSAHPILHSRRDLRRVGVRGAQSLH